MPLPLPTLARRFVQQCIVDAVPTFTDEKAWDACMVTHSTGSCTLARSVKQVVMEVRAHARHAALLGSMHARANHNSAIA